MSKSIYLDMPKVFMCGRDELLLWVAETAPWSALAPTHLVVSTADDS